MVLACLGTPDVRVEGGQHPASSQLACQSSVCGTGFCVCLGCVGSSGSGRNGNVAVWLVDDQNTPGLYWARSKFFLVIDGLYYGDAFMLCFRVGAFLPLLALLSICAASAVEGCSGPTIADQVLFLSFCRDKAGGLKLSTDTPGVVCVANSEEVSRERGSACSGVHPDNLIVTRGLCQAEKQRHCLSSLQAASGGEVDARWIDLVCHRGGGVRRSHMESMAGVLVPFGVAWLLLPGVDWDLAEPARLGLRVAAGKVLLSAGVVSLVGSVQELVADVGHVWFGDLVSPWWISQSAVLLLWLSLGRLDPVGPEEKGTLGGVVRACAQYGFVRSVGQLLGEAGVQVVEAVARLGPRARALCVPLIGGGLAGVVYYLARLWGQTAWNIADFHQGISGWAVLGISRALVPVVGDYFANLTEHRSLLEAGSYATLAVLASGAGAGLWILSSENAGGFQRCAGLLSRHFVAVGGWAFTNILGEPFLKHAAAGSALLPVLKVGNLVGCVLVAQGLSWGCRDLSGVSELANQLRSRVESMAVARGLASLVKDVVQLIEAPARGCSLRLCVHPVCQSCHAD